MKRREGGVQRALGRAAENSQQRTFNQHSFYFETQPNAVKFGRRLNSFLQGTRWEKLLEALVHGRRIGSDSQERSQKMYARSKVSQAWYCCNNTATTLNPNPKT